MTDFVKQKNKDTSLGFWSFCTRNFFWVVVLVSLLILLFGFLFLIKPKYEEVSALALNRDEKQDRFLSLIRESKDYLNEVSSSAKIYNEINQDDFEKINSILPKCGFHEELFGQMDYIVKKNGLLLSSISITPETSTSISVVISDEQEVNDSIEQKKIIRISFSLGGINYIGLKIFLKDIETNLRIMDINSLSFSPASNSLNIDIQTYCLE